MKQVTTVRQELCVKITVNNRSAENHITRWRMFKLLDTLPPTATGLDNVPDWCTVLPQSVT